jgi:hypothetical protein
MASKAPPPLIRSSKPFSVEIPQGSNSAKSRRSDVAPNDDLDISGKAGQYHGAELDLNKPLGVHKDTSGLHETGFAEDPHHEDNLNKLPSDNNPASATGPNIQSDVLKENFAGGKAGLALTEKGVNEARNAIHDNLQGIAQDSLKDNRQGVGQDALHDNVQGVANESLSENKAGIGREALTDNKAGISKDAITGNKAGISKEAIKDNLQGGASDALSNNKAGIGKEAIKDNLQGGASDALSNNKAGISKDAITGNKAGIGKDAITGNKAGIGKEHLADHIVPLPDTRGLQSAPSGKATDSAHSESGNNDPYAPASSHSKKKPSVAAQVKKSAKEISREAEVLMQAKIEKEKKLEEFHGRVDAIRKTVSSINNKLDELGK